MKAIKIEDFINKFAKQFNYTEIDAFQPETDFRSLEEWDSLISLCVLSMIKDEYGFYLKPEEMKSCKTIQDLCDAVNKQFQS